MSKVLFLVVISFIFGTCFSCKHDVLPDTCAETDVSYRNDIAPIILNTCTFVGCHWPNAPIGNIAEYSVLKEKIDSGIFYTMVIDMKLMPPGDPLTDAQFFQMKCWLESGAPEN